MASASIPSARTERVAIRRLPLAALIAAVVAAVGNLVVFLVSSVLGVSFDIPLNGPGTPAEPLPAIMVIIASAVPAFAAAALLALLGRFTTRPFRIFMIIAVVFGLLSFGGPASLPVGLSTIIALGLMHIVAGVAIVGVLSRWGREQ